MATAQQCLNTLRYVQKEARVDTFLTPKMGLHRSHQRCRLRVLKAQHNTAPRRISVTLFDSESSGTKPQPEHIPCSKHSTLSGLKKSIPCDLGGPFQVRLSSLHALHFHVFLLQKPFSSTCPHIPCTSFANCIRRIVQVTPCATLAGLQAQQRLILCISTIMLGLWAPQVDGRLYKGKGARGRQE